MTTSEKAAQIRSEHPGSYDDLSDLELVELYLEKFPHKRSQITDLAIRVVTPEIVAAEKTIRGQLAEIAELTGLKHSPQSVAQFDGFLKGIRKRIEMGQTAKNLDRLTLLLDAASNSMSALFDLEHNLERKQKTHARDMAQLDFEKANLTDATKNKRFQTPPEPDLDHDIDLGVPRK